ncbi:MAG: FAD-dependent monooxygenase [Candidatus Marinimicrobia bacterium]|nr:FAD-dependent monooxygenase [Candidatus Neomarinimicrobiota bacterium]
MTKSIIGSGLAGPLLAILLAEMGYSVDLFEKRSDPRLELLSAGRSINLALSHRGIEALKSAHVFEQVEPLLIPMKGRMIHCQNGELDYQPYSINPDEYINSVSRSELNKILMTAAEKTNNVDIHFSHALSQIQENKLVFKNGNTLEIENEIFGADGAGSVIRKHIDSNCANPSITKPLGHAYKELNIASGDNGEFQMDANSLHIWPRGEFMLIALPNTDKSFTCTLFMPNTGAVSFASLKTESEIIDFFKTHFSDALPLLENFPQSFFENPTGRLATIYADNWHSENFCLIGDAAHAVVPFFGQGMNASFEDCNVLMDCIEKGDGNWPKIFASYNKLRKPDADAIANMAIENYIEMRDSVAQPDYIARKKIANALFTKFPDKFIPRYNMVSFTSIPYSEVYARGEIQQGIISELDANNIDYDKAQRLIAERLGKYL